ncbi:MAG: hypothetical protein OEO82_08790, partial [Gammaproteobacteria bacterium]|nr:hypothetical protein [Gammaproteobacteria bacterium]
SLEIDENGDGVIDAYLDTNWAALNGETSSINSSNAAILAREVFNAVTGFGSVTSTAGAQFMPLAPFGQLESLGVSGDFGPLEIACNAGGTATVSGSKALPGTFSPNDQLDASFSGCARGGEELWGDMNFVPGSFATTPGDAYLVTGTVVHTNLERTLGGNCFSGSGTFNTSYDFLFTTTGVIDINSSASSFTVNAGGRGQQVSDAAVSAQITVGQPPVTVTRQSSGTVTSEDLDGSFVYQSVVPDVFLVDEDTSTGPFSGELLVTASDNSTMRMVAMDEFNLVLELDADGDSVIDDEIATTWATLGYPGWICGPPQL